MTYPIITCTKNKESIAGHAFVHYRDHVMCTHTRTPAELNRHTHTHTYIQKLKQTHTITHTGTYNFVIVQMSQTFYKNF